MVTINRSISFLESNLDRDINSNLVYSSSASSIESYQTDPDLLIKNYFSASPEERYKSRQYVIKQIRNIQSVMAILSYGASGEYRDSYEGAINLLAETDNLALLTGISLNSEEIYNLLYQKQAINIAEKVLEILINIIACAYKIHAKERFNLLVNVIPKINSRMIKASMIDALSLIADEMDREVIKAEIKKYNSDEDKYISDYAEEVLQDME